MTARTPVHSYYIDADFNVCHGATIMEPIEIVATIDALTAQVAALRDALRSIYHTLYEADTPNRQGPEYRDAISAAREQISTALAKDGAE